MTLWADGTLRRDSSFHTKQVNLNGCRDFRIEDEGELTFGHGDRVFSAATAIRLRDQAAKAHKMAILRGMPLSKRRQLEQLAAGFLAEQAAVSLPTRSNHPTRHHKTSLNQ